MKDLTYTEYLFLDCISTERPVKEATLYYVLIGKRTVSTMLQCRQYNLEAYFSVMPGMKPEVLKKGLERLRSQGLIAGDAGEGYLLTEAGRGEKAVFFGEHAHFALPYQMKFALVQGILRRKTFKNTQTSARRGEMCLRFAGAAGLGAVGTFLPHEDSD